MKILLRNFNEEVGKEKFSNQQLGMRRQDSNANGIRIVNYAT